MAYQRLRNLLKQTSGALQKGKSLVSPKAEVEIQSQGLEVHPQDFPNLMK